MLVVHVYELVEVGAGVEGVVVGGDVIVRELVDVGSSQHPQKNPGVSHDDVVHGVVEVGAGVGSRQPNQP